MKEKLNLTIEREVKEAARRMARKKGTSVSRIVEHLLKQAASAEQDWQPQKGSVVSEIAGSVPYHGEEDYGELLTSALMEKEGYEENSDR